MKEIISKIIEAEKRGDEIIKDANIKAKEIMLSAENEKDNLKRGSEMTIKQKTSATARTQEKLATETYNKMIAEGKELAEIYKSTKKTEKENIKNIIIGRLLEKYGAR